MLTNQTPVNSHPTPAERVLGPRPDTNDPMMAAARRANVGARVELDRRDASMQRDPHADLEARFETLEAAVAALARKLDDVESVADYAAERAEAAA